jgi:glycerol-3-phosphate dehydrogenase
VLLTGQKVNEMEQNLSSECLGAVHIPGEVVVDPWLYSISLAAHALENGADIYTNYAVDLDVLHFDDRIWTIPKQQRDNNRQVGTDQRPRVWKLQAKAVVNAAGIWGDVLETAVRGNQKSQKWTIKPRRGQYRIYHSNSKTQITHPIQPIPTQRTKGIFVFSTIYNQLVVGPTAEDQSSRTDRTINPLVAKKLDEHIQRIVPDLDVEKAFVGEYVGIRPGTDQRDYQIHLRADQHWITVAGIRSTGLTASLGIGDYVMRQLRAILEPPLPPKRIQTTPIPNLEQLVKDFDQYQGYVHILGHKFRVTHPLSTFGIKSLPSS